MLATLISDILHSFSDILNLLNPFFPTKSRKDSLIYTVSHNS